MVKAFKISTLSSAYAGKHRYKGREALILRQLIRTSVTLLHSRFSTMMRHGDGEVQQVRQREKHLSTSGLHR